MSGKLVLIVGPSGSGKGTLIDYIKDTYRDLVFSVSCTTRTPRPHEKEGEAYYFFSDEVFDKKIKEEAFLEWAHYGGHRYGTLKSEVLDPLKEGKFVVHELEIQGVEALRNLIDPEQLVVIYITAGSWEELKKRITARAPMSEEALQKRYQRYLEEQKFMETADYVIENTEGNLEASQKRLDEILCDMLTP